MFPTSIQPINAESLQELENIFKKAYIHINAQVETATSFGSYNRRAILAQIEAILKDLGSDVGSFIENEIPDQYRAGAKDAVRQLNKVGADVEIETGFNRVHKEVISALVDETGKSFAEAMTGVKRNISQVFNQAVKDQITQNLATGKIAGDTVRTTRAQILQTFKDNGFTALIDRSGKQWSLDTYTTMLIQTKSTESRNRGLVNRMVENKWDLVQVSAHGATDVCGEWEGKILSITGETPGYPTVDQATSAGLFHPNCRHAINVIEPSIAKQTLAYDADQGAYVAGA